MTDREVEAMSPPSVLVRADEVIHQVDRCARSPRAPVETSNAQRAPTPAGLLL